MSKWKNNRLILATSAGHILEYYDSTLYGFFAVMLAPLFFPSESPAIATICSFIVFAAGFVMRPFGGLIFGHLGDRYGRKIAFLLSIALVTVPTFGIGCLPTYEMIGVAAPFLLISFRLLQGISVGGEYGGAAIFIREHVKKEQVGFAGSMLATLGFVGAVTGTLLGSFFTRSHIVSWGWRIPFLLGGVFGIVIYFLRRNLVETPTFQDIKNKGKVVKLPILSVLRKRPLNILRGVGIGVNTVTPFYLGIIYMNSVLKSKFHLAASEVLACNTAIMLLWILLLPLAGYISDKIGKTRLMAFSAIGTLLLAYPSFLYIHAVTSLSALITFQILISLLSICFVAPCSAVLPELFPPEERYSGSAFSYSLGVAILGGTAPLIVASLVNHGFIMGPAFYLIFSSILGFLAVFDVKLFQDVKLQHEVKHKLAA